MELINFVGSKPSPDENGLLLLLVGWLLFSLLSLFVFVCLFVFVVVVCWLVFVSRRYVPAWVIKATAASRAALPIPTSVCSVFLCRNNGMAASVWDV